MRWMVLGFGSGCEARAMISLSLREWDVGIKILLDMEAIVEVA